MNSAVVFPATRAPTVLAQVSARMTAGAARLVRPGEAPSSAGIPASPYSRAARAWAAAAPEKGSVMAAQPFMKPQRGPKAMRRYW